VSEPERDMVNLEERYMIRAMYRKGQSISAIARQMGRDRKTIRKVIQAELSGAGDKPARRRRQKGVKLRRSKVTSNSASPKGC